MTATFLPYARAASHFLAVLAILWVGAANLFAGTIVGATRDVTGATYTGPVSQVSIKPLGTPQTIGTNVYWPFEATASITNNFFSSPLIQGWYWASPVIANPFVATPRVLIYMPDSDTNNIWQFNDCANIAARLRTYVSSNAFALPNSATNAITNNSTGVTLSGTFSGDGIGLQLVNSATNGITNLVVIATNTPTASVSTANNVATLIIGTNSGSGSSANAMTNFTTYSMTFNAGETNPVFVYSQDRGTQVNGLYFWNSTIGRYTNNGSTNMMWKSPDNIDQWVVGGVTNDPSNNENILYYTGTTPELPLNEPAGWLYLDGFGAINATVLVGTKTATNSLILQSHKGLTISPDDTGGLVDTNFAFSIKNIFGQTMLVRGISYSSLATFVAPYDYAEPGSSFVPNSSSGTANDGLQAYAFNLASQYNTSDDKRFTIGVSFLHGTNGQNGSGFEILNQWRRGYNSANNSGGQFNRSVVFDSKGGTTVGDQPYTDHGKDVPSSFWFSIYSGNGDGLKPKLGIGSGNLISVPVASGYENDATNTYYTASAATRFRLLKVKTSANNIPAAITVGASPFAYTNATGTPLMFWYYGTNNYSVALNGVTVQSYNGTNGANMILAPTNRVVITYTAAPILNTNLFQF